MLCCPNTHPTLPGLHDVDRCSRYICAKGIIPIEFAPCIDLAVLPADKRCPWNGIHECECDRWGRHFHIDRYVVIRARCRGDGVVLLLAIVPPRRSRPMPKVAPRHIMIIIPTATLSTGVISPENGGHSSEERRSALQALLSLAVAALGLVLQYLFRKICRNGYLCQYLIHIEDKTRGNSSNLLSKNRMNVTFIKKLTAIY